MAKRIGKYKISKKESALSLVDGGIASSDVQLQIRNPISGSNSAITITKTLHAGRTVAIPATEGSGITHVMPTPAEGLEFHFIYVGRQVADEDVAFDLVEKGTYEGNITWHDNNHGTSAGNAVNVVNCDESDNDLIDIKIPLAFDLHFVGKSASSYYVWGSVTSDTTPTCANG